MDYQHDGLTESIIQCIIKVHQQLGPGFLESIYRKALLLELRKSHLVTESEKEVIVRYRGEEVGRHRLDVVVEGKVIVELKTVDELNPAHYAQLRSYLKATRLPTGLLVNFAKEKADFRRLENP